MKNLYTGLAFCVIFILCLAAHHSNAQRNPYFYENFEKGVVDWRFIDTDGDGENFAIGGVLSGNGPGAYEGNFALESYSWNNGTLAPENYAISPKIDLSALTAVNAPLLLTWWHIAPDINWDAERYYVYVFVGDTTGVDMADSVKNLSPIYIGNLAGVNQWEKVEESLTYYLGKTIYLVFRHDNSIGQFYMALDHISIQEPVRFDADIVRAYSENEYDPGFIPSFLLDSIPLTVCVTNNGDQSFSSSDICVYGDGVLSSFQKCGTLNARIDPYETWCWKTTVGIDRPAPGLPVPWDSVNVEIDETDAIKNNNMERNISASIVNISDAFYATMDTTYFINLQPYALSPNIFVDPTLTYVGDRMTEIPGLLTNPNTGGANEGVIFGVKYDFKPGDRTQNAVLNAVKAIIAPENSGGVAWVEVYDYYNWSNTIGDPVQPVWSSKPLLVPLGFDDGQSHILSFNFKEPPILISGRYIIAVVEPENDSQSSIGMLGIRQNRFGYEEHNSVLGIRNASNEIYITSDADDFFCDVSRCQEIAWPISLMVSDTVLGVSSKELSAEAVSVYPNPATGMVKIHSKSDVNPDRITIRDVTGRIMYQSDKLMPQATHIIDVSSFETAIYFIEIWSGSEKVIKKLLKQ